MYSAVVVGAGPAGSSAARFLSKMGHEVLIVDRKEVVGEPKQCAEGLFKACFSEFSMDPADFVTGTAHYLEIVFPNGTRYRVKDDVCMLDRPKFDQHLLRLAERSGAELMLGRKVKRIDPFSGEVCFEDGGVIKARAIVGADGPASNVAKSMGVKNRLVPGAQVVVDWPRDDAIYAYLDKDICPYSSWIFPKVETGTANVGCFGTPSQLRRFIEKYEIEGEVQGRNGGAIPLGVASKLQEGCAVLIGDAGGLTNPFTGGGLYPAARSAHIAARAINSYLGGGKLDYESHVRKDLIASPLHMSARDLLASLTNDELNRLGSAMNGLVFPGVKFSSSPWLIWRALLHPGIVKMKYRPLLEVLLRYCLAGKVW